MAEFPSMPLFTDAYLGDTRHLTTCEHGAYLLLLMTAWRSDTCDLPDDDRLLARYAGLRIDHWRRMAPTIRAFFTSEGGRLTQKKQLYVRDYCERLRDSRSQAGKASALKRKELASTPLNFRTNGAPASKSKSKSKVSLPLNEEERKPPYSPFDRPVGRNRAASKNDCPVCGVNTGDPCVDAAGTARQCSHAERRSPQGSRLPPDWNLPEEWGQWAWSEMGWQRGDITEEAARFRDYWVARAGQAGRKADWQATWRNWCRNSKRPKPKAGNGAFKEWLC